MNPATGSPGDIAASAAYLGILCRPQRSSRIGVGEALEVRDGMFWRLNGHDNEAEAFAVSLADLDCDWELVTRDIIKKEWREASEKPW